MNKNDYEKAKRENMAGLSPKARTDFLLGKRFEPPYLDTFYDTANVYKPMGDYFVVDGWWKQIISSMGVPSNLLNNTESSSVNSVKQMRNYLLGFDSDDEEDDDFDDYYDPMHELRM